MESVITMDGNSWTAVNFYGQYNEASEQYSAYLTLEAYKTAAEDSPYVRGWLQAAVVSTNYAETEDYMSYRDDNDLYVDEAGVLGGDPGESYYNFIANRNTFVENITAIDLNACKMSATWSEDYVDLPTYIANNGGFAGAKVISGTLTNAVWTAISK